MPKMKTHSGAKMRHNQEHMSSRRKRRLNADQVVSPADFKKLKRQLGR